MQVCLFRNFKRSSDKLRRSAVVMVLLGFSFTSIAQFISNEALRNNLRDAQLLGNFRSGTSFAVNPNRVALRDFDSLLGQNAGHFIVNNKQHSFEAGFLPLIVNQQYNSQLPWGWNDGAMIPARGVQALLSAGVYANIGKHISLQFAPEYVYAENKYFDQFYQQLGDRVWASYYRFLNTSDIPERMGENAYSKFFAGQSSIRYNFKSYSVGISTENMWWGPGWKNALVMSTNAPGFLHATFNTTRPVRTSIGTFEGQVIAGKLEESGVLPPRIYSVYNNAFLYQPKNNEWRYITGLVLNWQPKWLPNLYLGIAKASYLYHTNISSPLDILPLQGFFGGQRTQAERSGKKASMGSLFARYVMPAEKAELYMELGTKDFSLMPWHLIQAGDYRRAYVAGFRKLFNSRRDAHIQVAGELTQLQAPTADLIMNPDSWYTHPIVRQGYTNMGQVIGSGIGPGSNSQAIEISWIRGVKRLGLEFERVRYNSDFYYYAFQYLQDFRRHWIDLSTTVHADWNTKNLFLSAQLSIVRSYNYKWLIIELPANRNFFVPGNEYLNVSARINAAYRF